MNVEELIGHIKIRPKMYVYPAKLDCICNFISGFLYNNMKSSSADELDLLFRSDFYDWVYNKCGAALGINHGDFLSWAEYISEATKNDDEAIDLFFNIADEFFKEYHKHNS